MANISKQFARLAINFRNNPFLRARLKLTVYYTGGVFIILLIFSLTVYGLFTKNITSNLEYDGVEQEGNANIELQIIDKAEDQLQTILITVDSFIIFLIIIFSYFLSRKTLKPIEDSYKKQKKFVADAAHELRTPLAVIKTGTEVVLNNNSSKEEYKKILVDSLEEINYLSAMVNDLFFLVRNDNLQKVEFSKINLSKLAKKQVDLMQVYAGKKKIILKNKIVDNLYLKGNKVYLKRLIANLIKNAIDYNKDKGEVIVSLSQDKKNIKLGIKDTGIGIAADDLKHIFSRFYKAEKSRSGQSTGAGLGLSIVKEIVELHQGKINIKSNLNQGTEILVLFKDN